MRRTRIVTVVLVLAGVFVSGCASDKMAKLPSPPATASAPPAGQATMVFYRSSMFGGAVQSSVFEVSGSAPEFVGIVSAGTKIAYVMAPGSHRFMVVGETGDFLDVDALAGKIYYARVVPRFGVWKARFSLKPVPANDSELAGDLEGCAWVENTEESQSWARRVMSAIVARKEKYMPEWEKKPDRETLKPEDGK